MQISMVSPGLARSLPRDMNRPLERKDAMRLRPQDRNFVSSAETSGIQG